MSCHMDNDATHTPGTSQVPSVPPGFPDIGDVIYFDLDNRVEYNIETLYVSLYDLNSKTILYSKDIDINTPLLVLGYSILHFRRVPHGVDIILMMPCGSTTIEQYDIRDSPYFWTKFRKTGDS